MALTPGTRLGVFELISAAAAFFDTKANKLRAMGWRPDYGKHTGDTSRPQRPTARWVCCCSFRGETT